MIFNLKYPDKKKLLVSKDKSAITMSKPNYTKKRTRSGIIFGSFLNPDL